MNRPVRVETLGHPVVESFLRDHEAVVTLAEARWLRAQAFDAERPPPTEDLVRRLWVELQLILDLTSPAIEPVVKAGARADGDAGDVAPCHPVLEHFIQTHAHCVTVAHATRLRRIVFPDDMAVTMELVTGLWSLLHYETLVRDRCVQHAEPTRELIDHMLQQVVADAAAVVGAVGEA